MVSGIHVVLLLVLGAFVCTLIGYAAGRRIALRGIQGRASAVTALRLRQELLVTGVCPTCDGHLWEHDTIREEGVSK